MKTIFNIYKVLIIIEHNKNSQNAKKFQALRFFRLPNFFSSEMKKKKKPTYFPKQATIFKIAQKFSKHFRKKISHKYFQA
jgi:hypothetical protein